MNHKHKIYSYFEYAAAKLYYDDIKLHLAIDQAESGFFLQNSEWDTGYIKSINFHEVWEKLNQEAKTLYINLARKEIQQAN